MARALGELVTHVVEITVGRVVGQHAAVGLRQRQHLQAASGREQQQQRGHDDADAQRCVALRGLVVAPNEAAEQRQPEQTSGECT